MEEAHRVHKDVAWSWVKLAVAAARSARTKALAGLPPRDRVVTPWSPRATRDWSA